MMYSDVLSNRVRWRLILWCKKNNRMDRLGIGIYDAFCSGRLALAASLTVGESWMFGSVSATIADPMRPWQTA